MGKSRSRLRLIVPGHPTGAFVRAAAPRVAFEADVALGEAFWPSLAHRRRAAKGSSKGRATRHGSTSHKPSGTITIMPTTNTITAVRGCSSFSFMPGALAGSREVAQPTPARTRND